MAEVSNLGVKYSFQPSQSLGLVFKLGECEGLLTTSQGLKFQTCGSSALSSPPNLEFFGARLQSLRLVFKLGECEGLLTTSQGLKFQTLGSSTLSRPPNLEFIGARLQARLQTW